jgi:hypothetical protein
LLRYDDWKGEYVRIEDGDEMVKENDQQKGWDSKHAEFCAELIELKGDSRVGYVPSKLAAQMVENDWSAKRHTQPILTEVTGLTGKAVDNAVTVDWNTVDINDQTDLVIAPISDIEMANLFGIPVDEEDKKKESDEADDDSNRQARQDDEENIDSELIKNAAIDVDDTHDDEFVCVYDKENPVIEVGRLFPTMDEFRMCFGLMQSNMSLKPRLCGQIKGSSMQSAKVLMVVPSLASGIYLLDANLMEEQ